MTTILHICDWYHPIGGAEKLLFDTLKLLEDKGHTNIVIYNDHPNQKPGGERPEYSCKGLEYWTYYLQTNILFSKKAIKCVSDVIKRHDPDVCHIHNFQNSYVTEYLIATLPCVRAVHDPRLYCFTCWKLLPDKRICTYPLGPECVQQGCLSQGILPRTTYDLNAPWTMRLLDVHRNMPMLIAESRAQIECMLENGFLPDQIAWLPNFTPITPEPEVTQLLHQHYNPQEKIVLFVGRASYEKGAKVLIDASGYLTSKCKIVLITAGPLLDEIRNQAALYDNVEVIPGLSYEETKIWYARSSLVVVPSVWIENFCLVGLEAFANMKPVIGSSIGGILDWLTEGETGWFFEPGNAIELAGKIDSALADQERLQNMGVAAYQRACNFYNSDIYLSRLLDIYEMVINRCS